MVRDDNITPLGRSLLYNLLGHIHSQQRLMHIGIGTPHGKTRIIVRLLQAERSKLLDRSRHISDLHIQKLLNIPND